VETKNREKLLMIGVGACIVLYLLNLLVISPMTDAWHRRSTQIETLKKQISDGHVLLRREDSILGRWKRISTSALSSTPTVAESQLFNAFDRWVRESGVTEGSFKPQLKETDDGYSTEECRADVSGNIQTIVRFLYDVEKDPMASRLEGVEITSRDDTGQQLSLGLELSGLLQPPPDPLLVNMDDELASIAADTNSPSGMDWNTFQSIAQKNIFDPTRSGRVRFSAQRHVPTVLAFSFNGGVEDGTNFDAFFVGEGAPRNRAAKIGDTLNGFKVQQITLHAVKLTDPSGAIVTLTEDQGMRREDNGPWTKSSAPMPLAMTSSESRTPEATAPASPGPAGESDIIRRLRLRHEQENK
jgi:hypothetical protein